MRVTATVLIDRPIWEVFAYATKPECWPEWISGLRKVSLRSSRRVDVGTTFEQVGRYSGHTGASSWEVTEYEPPRVFACRAITGPPSALRQVCEALSGATHLTWYIEEETAGLFKGGPQVERAITNQIQGDLARLKGLLEARAAREGAPAGT